MIKTKPILDFYYWDKFIPRFNEIEDFEEIDLEDNEMCAINHTIFGCS